MDAPRQTKPTPAEYEILEVLWARGPSTVRQVHETLAARRPSRYTTTLKLMQIMTDKGLVRRDESHKAHTYEAASPREETQNRLLDEVLDRVFSGSASQLVMRALSRRQASKQELDEIRRMIDRYRREMK